MVRMCQEVSGAAINIQDLPGVTWSWICTDQEWSGVGCVWARNSQEVCSAIVSQGWPSGPWRLASRRTSTPTIASTGCFSTRKTCTMWFPESDAIKPSRLGGSSAYCGRESELAHFGFTLSHARSDSTPHLGPVWDPVNCQMFYIRWYMRWLWGLFGGQPR